MGSRLISDDDENNDDDDDTLNNLMTFCSQLVHHSQRRSVKHFLCGSGIKIPLRYLISKQISYY